MYANVLMIIFWLAVILIPAFLFSYYGVKGLVRITDLIDDKKYAQDRSIGWEIFFAFLNILLWFSEKIKNLIITMFEIIRWIFVLTIIVTIISTIIYFFYKDDIKRTKFLKQNCVVIDKEYKVVNYGKTTYKCPNGKEYKD